MRHALFIHRNVLGFALKGGTMKIYLSGPMTGIEDFNYPTFNEVAEKFRSTGHEVFNPAEQFDGDTTKEWAEYLQHDVSELVNNRYDSIVLLPGWHKSVGSVTETVIAIVFGMKVVCVDDKGYIQHEQKPTKFLLEEILDIHRHTKTAKASILEEAQDLVHGDRGEDYGHPFEDFSKTALIWSAILGKKITPEQVALCMVGVKISREVNKPKRDNRIDGAGYFETLEMVHQYRAGRK